MAYKYYNQVDIDAAVYQKLDYHLEWPKYYNQVDIDAAVYQKLDYHLEWPKYYNQVDIDAAVYQKLDYHLEWPKYYNQVDIDAAVYQKLDYHLEWPKYYHQVVLKQQKRQLLQLKGYAYVQKHLQFSQSILAVKTLVIARVDIKEKRVSTGEVVSESNGTIQL